MPRPSAATPRRRPLRKGIVMALGGNSIVPAGEDGTIDQQWDHTKVTTAEVAALWQRDRLPMIITHGNGPQIGRILLRCELAAHMVDPLPLDVAVADTEAGMGYMIEHLLGNHFLERGVAVPITTIITRVVVDPDDAGWHRPSKPVGLFYTAEQAQEHMAQRGWVMAEDAGRGWRRVVASPRPLEIVELDAIRILAEKGHIVIAVGGGGIPVIRQSDGTLKWCECVIDKDLASALLAEAIGIERLVIVTGVPQVCLDWGKPSQRGVGRLSAGEAAGHLAAGQFPAGSMGPKIAAAINFARAGGTTIITQPGDIASALAGETGTWVVPDADPSAANTHTGRTSTP